MALDDRRLDEAVEGLQEATRNYPDRWQVWFDLGLAYKLRRDWVESVAASRRAAELGQAKESYFNLGVAATAIRDWDTARYAWRGLGIDVGTGPEPRGDFGLCPVRLNPDTDGEVVWGRRIDPCRIRIELVPLPESGHRWQDVVLHDVVPAGRRTLDGRSLPVFDELMRMDPSDAPTFTVEVVAGSREDRDALGNAITDADLGFEDWTESIEVLCAACSRGEGPHEQHTVAESAPWRPDRRVGLAGGEQALRATLGDWSRDGFGRDIVAFEQVG